MPLPEPFFVLATQNPIEQEGTYPLPEAQLDRFMFNIVVDYPTAEEELEIVQRTTTHQTRELEQVLSAARRSSQLQEIVRRVAGRRPRDRLRAAPLASARAPEPPHRRARLRLRATSWRRAGAPAAARAST